MLCRQVRLLFLKQERFASLKVCVNNSFLSHIHTSSIVSAGHSKWANIRHIKALKDGQKSAVFTRYSRQIRLAIQDGGSPDPALNSMLRNVIDEALRKNMPIATIQNAIKKSTQNKALLKKHFLYWRFQQKVFVICVLYTENFTQLKMELASVLRKAGTVYVEGQHLFEDAGIIEATLDDERKSALKSLDELEQICTEDAIECGVEDVEVLDHTKGTVNFICDPVKLNVVSQALKAKKYLIENSEHVFIPKHTVKLSEDELKAYDKFQKKVRELPGIEELYDNIEVDTE